jgi:tetratricopeptide (TPR) repeat protein
MFGGVVYCLFYGRGIIFRVCLIMILVLLTRCSPGIVFSGKEDYSRLNELEKFEYEYSLHEGLKLRLLGDYGRSIYFFTRCIEIFPYSGVAHFELSHIYAIAGEMDQAVYFASRALEIDPGNIWYYHHIARLHLENDDTREAIEIYEKAVEVFPDEYDLYYALAAYYTSYSSYDDALLVYEKIEDLIGIDERVSLSKKQIYMKTGQFENAHNEISKLINEYPEEASYYGILAELYGSIGMVNEAIASYEKLFELDPENGMAQLSISEFYLTEGRFNDAVDYLKGAFRNPGLDFKDKIEILTVIMQDTDLIGNYTAEIELIGKLLQQEYPEESIVTAVMADFYISLGWFEEAGSLLYELYQKNPDNRSFAEQLIGVVSYKGNYNDIIEIGEKISEIFPESYIIQYFIGLAYLMNDETGPAITVFEKAIENEEIDTELKGVIYSYLGDLFHRIDDYVKSDLYFEKSLNIDPNNLVSLNNHAYYLALRGEKLENALEYSLKTIEKEPENSSFLDTYAWILYKMGRHEDSLFYIELAYEKSGSESYEIVKHFGQILIKLERYNEAEYFLNKARGLTEDHKELDQILKDAKYKISH